MEQEVQVGSVVRVFKMNFENGLRTHTDNFLSLHEFLVKVMDQGTLDELVGREAFGRGAECWEVANVIVFLASDYSSYMTGEIVSVSSQRA